jgi:DNA-binding beta-propeller fold protein YncE
MRWRMMTTIATAIVLLLVSSGCGSDGGSTSTSAPEGGGAAAPADPEEPAEGCPGDEVGAIPATVEIPAEAPYDDGEDPSPLGVAVGEDGAVFFNLAFHVYCIADDTLFEVATPETVPYPEGDEESSYADIAVSPDGNPLLADWMNPRVFELEDGELTVVPGSDDPAIGGSRSIESAPDGTLYVTGLDQSGTTGVFEISDGEATPYAGPGEYGIANDGEPATDSYLAEPEGIHLDDEGNLYIADRNNARVAVVDADGTIDTLAGGQHFDDRPDSDALSSPGDVAISPDGEVLVLDDGELVQVEDDGSTTLLSGESSDCYPDVSPSAEACALDEVDLSAFRIAFDPDGTLWVTDAEQLLRVVDGEVEVAIQLESTD